MNPKQASAESLPDLSIACLLALSDDEWSKHIIEAFVTEDRGVDELKALERSLAAVAMKIVERAVYLRWQIMLRHCGPLEAHRKSSEHARWAREAVSKHLMRRPKKT